MPRLTDPAFRYTNAASTDIRETLRRHGFKPTTERERATRQRKTEQAADRPRLTLKKGGKV